METPTLNEAQRLFVIPAGSGYSCLGFEVCTDWTRRIATELDRPDLMPDPAKVGTLAALAEYEAATEAARVSGRRLNCFLVPQLIGLEGKRVEVVDKDGETPRRFQVGKSTGWLPCHLEIARRNSSGGRQVYGDPFKSVRVVS
jgi:hypothetical protein